MAEIPDYVLVKRIPKKKILVKLENYLCGLTYVTDLPVKLGDLVTVPALPGDPTDVPRMGTVTGLSSYYSGECKEILGMADQEAVEFMGSTSQAANRLRNLVYARKKSVRK